MIVGNKSDLAPPPSTSPKKELLFVSASAKSGSNVERVFQGMSKLILEKIKSGKIDPEKVRISIPRRPASRQEQAASPASSSSAWTASSWGSADATVRADSMYVFD
jgi:hypothetical protein